MKSQRLIISHNMTSQFFALTATYDNCKVCGLTNENGNLHLKRDLFTLTLVPSPKTKDGATRRVLRAKLAIRLEATVPFLTLYILMILNSQRLRR